MKRTIKIVVAVAVVLAAVGIAWAWMARGKPQKARYQTAKVIRGNLVAQVTATGTLQPVVTSPVGAQVSGIIYKIYADYNSSVTEGQILVELDPALFKNAVAQAEAQLATSIANEAKAQAALADAKRQRDRSAELAKQHFVAQSDADTAQANYDGAVAALKGAQANVIQARASLDRARLDLQHSVIRAPVTGTVISRNVDLGQAVASSFTAPTLFTIAKDLSKMQVHASIDEADIGQIQVGQVAIFTVDAFRGEKFKAKVSQIRNAPQTVQNVVTYDVVMDVDNPDLKLRPGMTANVRIVSANKHDVLLVPNMALRFKPPLSSGEGKPGPGAGAGAGAGGWQKRDKEEGGASLYVPDGEGVKKVKVQNGLTDGSYTEIVSGLDEGQEVIVDLAKDAKEQKSGPPSGMGGARGFGRGF